MSCECQKLHPEWKNGEHMDTCPEFGEPWKRIRELEASANREHDKFIGAELECRKFEAENVHLRTELSNTQKWLTECKIRRDSFANHAANVQTDLATARKEIERLHTRLEDNYAFDSDLKRISVEPGSIPDGIECRDETIKLQHERIERLEADLEERDKIARAAGYVEEVKRLREALQQAISVIENAVRIMPSPTASKTLAELTALLERSGDER